jgi:ribosome-binding factor A
VIKEKNILSEELRLNEVIKQQLQASADKLRQELKELKNIIKIPRLHFKYLEKLEYDEIITQLKDIEQ